MQTVSVVIPVYQGERTVLELYRQLITTLTEIAVEFELIFVEDGGRDGAWSLIAGLAKMDQRVHGIRMSRNYGQHNALLCGIRAARHDIIITIDDDLQHPPGEIVPMLAALKPQFDVVYGAPEQRQYGLLRYLASALTRMTLASAMGVETARHASAFRVFRTHLRDGFADYHSPFVSIDVLLTWSTTRFTVIRVRHGARAAGVSGYTIGKLVGHALDQMTGFSTLPLRIFSFVGFAFVLFGVAILVYVVANYLIHGQGVPGFAFLASITAIFSGVQLFGLGIFGEYLARIYLRSMDRPAYVIRETLLPGKAAVLSYENVRARAASTDNSGASHVR